MNNSIKRPIYLNLFQIRMPVMAIVSILHRASGVLWVLVLPGLLYAFELSIRNEQGFQQILSWSKHPLLQLIFIVMLWFLLHHFYAGIRFLLLDIDVAVTRTSARRAAWLVHAASLISLGLLVGIFL